MNLADFVDALMPRDITRCPDPSEKTMSRKIDKSAIFPIFVSTLRLIEKEVKHQELTLTLKRILLKKCKRGYQQLIEIINPFHKNYVGPEELLGFLRRFKPEARTEEVFLIFRKLDIAENPCISSDVLKEFLEEGDQTSKLLRRDRRSPCGNNNLELKLAADS